MPSKSKSIKYHGFAHILLLIIIVLVGIVAIGYSAYNNSQIQKSGPASPNQINPEIDTSDWETYTNTGFNYTVKHPKDFAIDTDSHLCLKKNDVCQIMFNTHNNIDIFKKKTAKVVAERSVLDSGFKYSISEVQIANYDAVKVVIESQPQRSIVVISHPTLNRFVELSSNSSEVFDQILSTFKFLGTEENNNCYQDSECGINVCDCKADLEINIPNSKKACARVCEGRPKCVNNKCVLVK